MHGAVVCLGVVRLKLDVQGQWGGRSLDLDGQGGGESRMCIIPYKKNQMSFFILEGFLGRKEWKMRFIVIHNYSWIQSPQNYILLKGVCSPKKKHFNFPYGLCLLF